MYQSLTDALAAEFESCNSIQELQLKRMDIQSMVMKATEKRKAELIAGRVKFKAVPASSVNDARKLYQMSGKQAPLVAAMPIEEGTVPFDIIEIDIEKGIARI